MKAITTKYSGPTEKRGSRVTATDSDGNRAHIPYHEAPNDDEAHRMAAEALIRKMGWGGVWKSGGLKVGRAWVCITSDGPVQVVL